MTKPRLVKAAPKFDAVTYGNAVSIAFCNATAHPGVEKAVAQRLKKDGIVVPSNLEEHLAAEVYARSALQSRIDYPPEDTDQLPAVEEFETYGSDIDWCTVMEIGSWGMDVTADAQAWAYIANELKKFTAKSPRHKAA